MPIDISLQNVREKYAKSWNGEVDLQNHLVEAPHKSV